MKNIKIFALSVNILCAMEPDFPPVNTQKACECEIVKKAEKIRAENELRVIDEERNLNPWTKSILQRTINIFSEESYPVDLKKLALKFYSLLIQENLEDLTNNFHNIQDYFSFILRNFKYDGRLLDLDLEPGQMRESLVRLVLFKLLPYDSKNIDYDNEIAYYLKMFRENIPWDYADFSKQEYYLFHRFHDTPGWGPTAHVCALKLFLTGNCLLGKENLENFMYFWNLFASGSKPESMQSEFFTNFTNYTISFTSEKIPEAIHKIERGKYYYNKFWIDYDNKTEKKYDFKKQSISLNNSLAFDELENFINDFYKNRSIDYNKYSEIIREVSKTLKNHELAFNLELWVKILKFHADANVSETFPLDIYIHIIKRYFPNIDYQDHNKNLEYIHYLIHNDIPMDSFSNIMEKTVAHYKTAIDQGNFFFSLEDYLRLRKLFQKQNYCPNQQKNQNIAEVHAKKTPCIYYEIQKEFKKKKIESKYFLHGSYGWVLSYNSHKIIHILYIAENDIFRIENTDSYGVNAVLLNRINFAYNEGKPYVVGILERDLKKIQDPNQLKDYTNNLINYLSYVINNHKIVNHFSYFGYYNIKTS